MSQLSAATEQQVAQQVVVIVWNVGAKMPRLFEFIACDFQFRVVTVLDREPWYNLKLPTRVYVCLDRNHFGHRVDGADQEMILDQREKWFAAIEESFAEKVSRNRSIDGKSQVEGKPSALSICPNFYI